MAGTATRWHERKSRLPCEPYGDPAPSISGSGAVGQTLTCDTSGIIGEPPPSVTYQWQSDGGDIVGATSSTYVLQAGESGTTVTCVVTATNYQGTTIFTTNGIAVA